MSTVQSRLQADFNAIFANLDKSNATADATAATVIVVNPQGVAVPTTTAHESPARPVGG